jgi:hypothetical protein
MFDSSRNVSKYSSDKQRKLKQKKAEEPHMSELSLIKM